MLYFAPHTLSTLQSPAGEWLLDWEDNLGLDRGLVGDG